MTKKDSQPDLEEDKPIGKPIHIQRTLGARAIR